MVAKLSCALLLALHLIPANAEADERAPATCPPQPASERDGRHDFDFNFGTWTTKLRRLQKPLSGSTTWVDYEGSSTVREILDGRANLVELEVEGPAGRIEGLSLRLYEPASRQWSLNFASIRTGTLSPPVYGAFHGTCAEFYGQDTLEGRAILVRFVIADITRDSARFEQAFSANGGRTWEVNWIATDTRRE